MEIRDLIPWNRERRSVPAAGKEGDDPFVALRRDVNRVFEDFWSRFERPFAGDGGIAAVGPRTDVAETDEAVEISMELPGLEDKDVEVNLSDDILTIRGEKKRESEKNGRGYYMAERSWGAFHRMIPLPPGVDAEKAEARFRNGVLTVTLPKTEEARARVRRIDVKAG